MTTKILTALNTKVLTASSAKIATASRLILAIAMHLFILAMFGPAGLNWNDIVWPWTAAMAVFDLRLFSGTPEFSWR